MKFKEESFSQFARRFFIKNGFDGAITILGVVIGSFLSGVTDPTIVLLVGVNTCVAMLVAGLWGALLTESAEKKKDLIETEKAMLKDLDDTKVGKRSKKETLLLGAVNGLSPFALGLVLLIPFLFAIPEIITIQTGYTISFVLTGVTLLVMGTILGKISRTSKIKYALLMLLAGATAAGINLVVNLIR